MPFGITPRMKAKEEREHKRRHPGPRRSIFSAPGRQKTARKAMEMTPLDDTKPVNFIRHKPEDLDDELPTDEELTRPIDREDLRKRRMSVKDSYRVTTKGKIVKKKPFDRHKSYLATEYNKTKVAKMLYAPGREIRAGNGKWKTRPMFYRIQLEKAIERVGKTLKVNLFDHFVARALENDIVLIAIMRKLVSDQVDVSGKIEQEHTFRPIQFVPVRPTQTALPKKAETNSKVVDAEVVEKKKTTPSSQKETNVVTFHNVASA